MDQSDETNLCPDGHSVEAGMSNCGQCGQAVLSSPPAYEVSALPAEGQEQPAVEEPSEAGKNAPLASSAYALGRSWGRASKKAKVGAGSVALMLVVSLGFVVTRSGSSEADASNTDSEESVDPGAQAIQDCAETVGEWTAQIVNDTISGGQSEYRSALYTLGTRSKEMQIIGRLMGPTLQRSMQAGAAAAGEWMSEAAFDACTTAYPNVGAAGSYRG